MNDRCRTCGSDLPDDAGFCPKCGAPVDATAGDPAPPDREARSRGPAAVAPRPAPQGGERRPVTALFADVVGSTSLTESLDPEDWTAIMNRAFEALSEGIARYEGTIARLTGDGVLALFGAPVAHEDDPERALRAALDMLAAVRELSGQLADTLRQPLEIRVGISTGLVVVGEMGSDYRTEYTAFGDAVNVAARMQALALPGTVAITGATYARVAPLFDVRPLGSVSVKGKREPVEAYQVLGLKRAPGARRGVPGLRSPMIGRADELRRLRAALVPARAGRGRVAIVLGEPGIGKTRLVEEFRGLAAAEGDVRWAVARCLSYGRNLPFHVLADLVRAIADVPPDADDEAVDTDLSSCLERLLGERADETRVYLAHLLGLRVDDPRVVHRDADVLQGHYVEALSRLVRAAAEEAPLVLQVEDMHWADPSSASVLARLLPTIATAPLLLICTSRPERDVPGWEFLGEARRRLGEALVEIELAPLSPEASRDVVGHLLEIDSIPDAVRDRILGRADGNPFFVEEVVRMLIDRGVLVRRDERWIAEGRIDEVEIPETVRGLLLSRIDRLPEPVKSSLQVASVVGRRFSPEIVDEAHPAATPDALLELEAAGLVHFADSEGDLGYTFRHALVQETAYASLLRQERARLHALVGEALARRAPEPPGASSAVLARHFEEAGDVRRSVGYALAAAEFAHQRSAVREAKALYDRVLALLEREPEDEQVLRWRVEAGLGRAVTGFTFVPNDESRADLEALLPLAQSLRDERLLAQASLWLVRLRVDEGDVEGDAFAALLERTKSLAERLDDPRLQAWFEAVLAEMAEESRLRTAASRWARAADLFEAQESRGDAALCAARAAVAHARLGEFAHADQLTERAEALAAGSDDPNLRLDIDLFRGIVESERGATDEAIAFTERSVELAEEVGNTRCLAYGSFRLGDLRLRAGDTPRAISALERSQGVADYCSMGGVANLSRIWLEAARMRVGAAEDGLPAMNAGLSRARLAGDRLGEAHGLRHRAIARLATGAEDWPSIRADFDESLRILEELEARPAVARVAWEYGRLLRSGGFDGDAWIERAEALFDELGVLDDPRATNTSAGPASTD